MKNVFFDNPDETHLHSQTNLQKWNKELKTFLLTKTKFDSDQATRKKSYIFYIYHMNGRVLMKLISVYDWYKAK